MIFLSTVLLFTLSGILLVQHSSVCTAKPLPNIILILADDLGYGDVSLYNPYPLGNISTPHIDNLGRNGMIFLDAHTTSSVCTPSRYSILTGRYNWRSRLKSGVLGGYDTPLINPERSTLASVLKRVGYTTACIGKWHLGLKLHTPMMQKYAQRGTTSINLNTLSSQQQRLILTKPVIEGPRQVGFDHFHGISASLDMPPYLYIHNNNFTDGENIHMKPKSKPGRQGMSSTSFSHVEVLDALASNATEFLNSNIRKGGPPIFLYLPLTSPHTPIVPSRAFRGKSDLGPYGDLVMQTDDVVGRIISTLTRLNCLDDTLILFTSDNGFAQATLSNPANAFLHPHFPSGIFRGMKSDIYEGGHRIPFIVQWPGVVQPRTINKTPISLVDLFATFLDITHQSVGYKDARKNHGEDSTTSLLPLFMEKCDYRGQETSCVTGSENNILSELTYRIQRKQLVMHSISGCFAIREGKYLLALCSNSGGWTSPEAHESKIIQFFDLDADPGQRNDLSDHFGTTDPATQIKRYSVNESLEAVYVRLLVGMLRIYYEWELDDSPRPVFLNHRIIQGLLIEQLRSKVLSPGHASIQGLDQRSLNYLQDCIVGKKCARGDTRLYRHYFASDLNNVTSSV